MRSGCEFCSESEVGRGCFLSVAFISGAGKELWKVELGFGDGVCWQLVGCREERAPERWREWGCAQEKLLFLPFPSPQISQSPGLVQALGW